MQFLKVSDNKRYLTYADASPFLWIGDTAWQLFHSLNYEEAEYYLKKRAEQGFNVVQAVTLAELSGVTAANANGDLPLIPDSDGSFSKAEPDLRGESNYWTHVDRIIDLAADYGIYVALLPTWGDKWNAMGKNGPELLNGENAYSYGTFLAERYGERPNIIWVLQGDRPLFKRVHFEVHTGLARAIRERANPAHLITAHPPGHESSSTFFHEEEWLDFNMIQSSHGSLNLPTYEFVAKDRALEPTKPTFDAEPRYEDHPINFKPEMGYFDDYDVRQACYWAVFAGGLGVTYGHHSVWAMVTEPTPYWPLVWQEALDRPGALQMQHLRSVVESVNFQTGEPRQDLLQTELTGANYTAVFAGEGFLLAYSPNGLAFELDLKGLAGLGADTAAAQWMNPRTGAFSENIEVTGRFTPPSAGRNNDWVLVLKGQGE